MNLAQFFTDMTKAITKMSNPGVSPAKFRRGVRRSRITRIVGISKDTNAWHVGTFRGGITPMRRRFNGVSRTANR